MSEDNPHSGRPAILTNDDHVASQHSKKLHNSNQMLKSCLLFPVFYWKGFVYYEFLPGGETINCFCYLKTLRHLREAVKRKSPELQRNGEWVRHNVYYALLICDYCMTVILQLPTQQIRLLRTFSFYQNSSNT